MRWRSRSWRARAADVRVVSLVPSITEGIAAAAPGVLVGAPDWCTHPADLDVTRVGGTKNPDLAMIAALEPDLVIATAEEQRTVDIDAMRELGLPLHVTDIRTVDQALDQLAQVLALVGAGDAPWLAQARAAWAVPEPVASRRLRAVIPIWRRPWMHVGADTYAGDVLARLGVDNVLADSPERYPAIPLPELPSVDVVVLPDEPYAFAADDGPEAFPGVPCALVSGRALTWYGPGMIDAPALLRSSIRAALESQGASR